MSRPLYDINGKPIGLVTLVDDVDRIFVPDTHPYQMIDYDILTPERWERAERILNELLKNKCKGE